VPSAIQKPRPNRPSSGTGRGTRLTLMERAIDRSTIDVAACIRWTFFGIAAVILAAYSGPLATGGVEASKQVTAQAAKVVRPTRPAGKGGNPGGAIPVTVHTMSENSSK
jgi:hypothetical protein